MRRHGGISDFRVLGGQSSLVWFEHGGLACALAGFTVFPGALGWHIKCLIQQGQPSQTGFVVYFTLELLQLTWACSSLYLMYLYSALFLNKRAFASNKAQQEPQTIKRYFTGLTPAVSFLGGSLLIALTGLG